MEQSILIVLLAYCSLSTGTCGVVVPNTPAPITDIDTCRRLAKVMDANKSVQEQIFMARTIRGPWKAHAVCGTKRQADEANTFLSAADARDQRLREKMNEPEHEGERDPFPNGG